MHLNAFAFGTSGQSPAARATRPSANFFTALVPPQPARRPNPSTHHQTHPMEDGGEVDDLDHRTLSNFVVVARSLAAPPLATGAVVVAALLARVAAPTGA